MKIAVSIGHNTRYNSGANGILNENKCNMEVGTILIEKLSRAGHQVIDVLPRGTVTSQRDSLKQRTDKANAEKVDFFIDIHFNAGGGYGTEVLYVSDKGKALGEPVLKELVNILGSKNRGMKYRDNLWVLNQTTMPAYLVECLFVDSESDSKLYNPENIAEGIFRGITGKPSAPPAPTPSQDIKNLQMSLNVMGFTDSQGNKLEVDGFNGDLTRSASKKLVDYLNNNILK